MRQTLDLNSDRTESVGADVLDRVTTLWRKEDDLTGCRRDILCCAETFDGILETGGCENVHCRWPPVVVKGFL